MLARLVNLLVALICLCFTISVLANILCSFMSCFHLLGRKVILQFLSMAYEVVMVSGFCHDSSSVGVYPYLTMIHALVFRRYMKCMPSFHEIVPTHCNIL